ncbi:MAG: cupredoxin domain-containing protein [Patescibacteria group bacterium]|nr:cupredoxin domain-containing protein [Patescibacteria group bacterium]
MNNKLVWLVVAVLVVGGGGALLLSNKSNNQPAQTVNQAQNTTPTQQMEESNVTVTGSGYEPKTITVKQGTKVVWKNTSGGPVTVNSDAHPTHLLWPFLNLGKFEDGSSVSVVFEKPGTYTYHNHLNVSQVGTVIVK